MILGTAGHVDHGKTTLVRVLTGVDTDRLSEEKRRGITIELGFAPLALEGAPAIGVVDVPGHEAFVRTMLAGATGVDLALLVVAADEGIMPQTREHLAILNLLGVRGGVVALTKCDLADDEWIQLVEDELRSVLGGGAFERAAIARCSAVTGVGIDRLRSAIAAAALAIPARAADDLFRMPIDRAFSVKGTGTVVTGTVWSGTVNAEDTVVLLPAGTTGRVRAVERHGEPVRAVGVGDRAAIALGGVDRSDIDVRGTVVVRAGDPWMTSRVLRADVACLDGAPVIGPRTHVRFHLGTADVGARLVAAGGPVRPGARIPVRVILDAPVVARGGDRFVIRCTSPAATVGGGVVTDPEPPGRRAKPWTEVGASDAQRLAWMLAEAGGKGIQTSSLPVRLGLRPADVEAMLVKSKRTVVRVGAALFNADVSAQAEASCLAAIRTAHEQNPLEPGLPVQVLRSSLRSSLRASPELVDAAIARLVAATKITLTDGRAARAGWVAGGGETESRRAAAVLAAVQAAGAQPPSVDELAASHGRDVIAILKMLARRGEIVAVAEDRYFGREVVAEVVAVIRQSLTGGGLTASQLREKIGVTRKYLIPLLEYCDGQGITVRRGDTRVLGSAL